MNFLMPRRLARGVAVHWRAGVLRSRLALGGGNDTFAEAFVSQATSVIFLIISPHQGRKSFKQWWFFCISYFCGAKGEPCKKLLRPMKKADLWRQFTCISSSVFISNLSFFRYLYHNFLLRRRRSRGVKRLGHAVRRICSVESQAIFLISSRQIRKPV